VVKLESPCTKHTEKHVASVEKSMLFTKYLRDPVEPIN
jgi:hypothetical protein